MKQIINNITTKIKSFLTLHNFLILLYWLIFALVFIFAKTFIVYATSMVLALLAYLPYKIFLNKQNNKDYYKDMSTNAVIKKEAKPTLVAFLIFLGIFSVFNSILMPQIDKVGTAIKYMSTRSSAVKVVDLKNLEIYIDEENRKSYSFYKINGTAGIEYLDTDNLILSKDTELPERFGAFNKIEDYEVAFATYKTELYTEGLFKIKYKDNEYIVKAYIPQENCLSLLTKSGFKDAVQIKFKDGTIQHFYINQTTKEIAISNDDIVVVSPYAETPYNKDDYFSYRYDIFNNVVPDKTMVNPNINVAFLNTYTDISSDIKRVTFYSEGNQEEMIYSEVIEIVFAETAYVFRSDIINVANILSVTRAS